jgi:hypothetical protein
MKKKNFISGLIAIIAITTIGSASAQQISVVSPAGATSVYTDLNLAITGAETGSTVYLSGGGFQVSDETKITKKLSIIGIGHKANNDNANGYTTVSGNLFFEGGSDNSVVMGVYLSGNVNIATSETAVNNFLLRYCNINSVQVKNSACQNILVNQNYIRSTSHGSNSACSFTNNVLHSLRNINGGVIDHNIVRNSISHRYDDCIGCGGISCSHVFLCVSNSQITNNILIDPSGLAGDGIVSNNVLKSVWGENSLQVSDWSEVFEYEGTDYPISANTNFHIKAGQAALTAATDGGEVGIYGGTGFSDKALPPGPRIVSKKVAEQTDENGNLHVEIQVSAE